MLKEAGHIRNTVVLIFRHIQCLHLLYSEVAWVLVSSPTQVQLEIMLDPFYLPYYHSVSYYYALIKKDTSLDKNFASTEGFFHSEKRVENRTSRKNVYLPIQTSFYI